MSQEKKIILISFFILIVLIGGGFYYFNSREKVSNISGKQIKTIDSVDQEAILAGMKEENKELRKIDESDHFLGQLDAPVQLIVYGEFSCSFCSEFDSVVKQAQKEFGDNLVIAFRHFSLRSSARAIPSALASECAGEQGKFWEMHDKLFSRNENDYLGEDLFKKYAKELSLDENKFSDCLSTEKYKEKIISQIKEAGDFGVIGTPTSFLNGRLLPGAYQFEDFVDSQERERSGLRSLISKEFGK